MYGVGVRSIFLLCLVARSLETMHVCFYVHCSDCGNVCCAGSVVKDNILALE